MKNLIIAAVLLLSSGLALADAPQFNNLTPDDYKNVLKDISGAWSYTSVTGASSLGHLFGFEVGLEAGTAKTPNIDSLSQANNGPSISSLPSAALFGAITVPFGLTVETLLYPNATVSGVSAKYSALALKWTFSELLDLPLDVSAKVFASNSEYSFSYTQQGVGPVSVDMTDKTQGLVFQVSKKFVFVEPYLNLGVIKAKGDINATGNATFFNQTYVQGTSDEETVTGNIFAIGADLNLLFFRLGLEAGKVFNNNKLSAKLSVYF